MDILFPLCNWFEHLNIALILFSCNGRQVLEFRSHIAWRSRGLLLYLTGTGMCDAMRSRDGTLFSSTALSFLTDDKQIFCFLKGIFTCSRPMFRSLFHIRIWLWSSCVLISNTIFFFFYFLIDPPTGTYAWLFCLCMLYNIGMNSSSKILKDHDSRDVYVVSPIIIMKNNCVLNYQNK